MARFGAVIVVDDLAAAVRLANAIAPEHLELMVADPWALVPAVRHAGAVFLGRHTPEVAGDYLAGPNHVLPTGGTARFSSALSVDDFQTRSSLVSLTPEAIRRWREPIVRSGRAGGARGACPLHHDSDGGHMSFDLAAVIRPEVRAQIPYHTGPEPAPGRRVKLDANESPFALGEALRGELAAEFARALADVELHRYPDPTARDLRALLARDLGVAAERILVANGSDEAIQMLLMAAAGPGAAIAIPVPTFAMYAIGARAMGTRVVEVPLGDAFRLDADRFLEAVRQAQPRLVFLAWPNNPTGNLFDGAAVEAILAACGGRDGQALVVVDEAYVHYSGRSFLAPPGRFSRTWSSCARFPRSVWPGSGWGCSSPRPRWCAR